MKGLAEEVLALLRDAVGTATEAEEVCQSCGAATMPEPSELACWVHRAEDLIAREDASYKRRHP